MTLFTFSCSNSQRIQPNSTLLTQTNVYQLPVAENTKQSPPTPTQTLLPLSSSSTVETSTPALPTVCPTAIPRLAPTPWFVGHSALDKPDVTEQEVLNYLNMYGSSPIITKHEEYSFTYQDFTNDGIPELAFVSGLFHIFGCVGGKYQTLFSQRDIDGWLTTYSIIDIQDGNQNGIPEILFFTGQQSQGGHSYRIYEWDGIQFRNLLAPTYSDSPDSGEISVVSVDGDVEFQDLNHDGFQEIVSTDGIPIWSVYNDGLPWRSEKRYFKWDGYCYSIYRQEFSSPVYRFQSAQDGDRLSLAGEYEQALYSYRQAIFSNELKWWSPELRKHLQDIYLQPTNTPTPIPPLPDDNEYYVLAAYARYRIMLLYVLQGWNSDAKTVYDTLQKMFGEGKVGHIYAEAATIFLEEYHATANVQLSCQKVVEYVTANEVEALKYLGNIKDTSDLSLALYHGFQSLDYSPKDICPFK
ncbi:MAG: hypothetical protein MUO77_20075 [Anaerolineales bacterium]|nr:hypothetical protein [Anaerolineales bacterium]